MSGPIAASGGSRRIVNTAAEKDKDALMPNDDKTPAGVQGDDDLVYHKICTLIEPLNDTGAKLTRETDLVADLEIDSVAILDVVMEIEDSYDISIPVNTISETRTIGELVDAIHAIKKEQA
ncbi:MAG: acyl carrier protein [Pseudomonadota bacterium]